MTSVKHLVFALTAGILFATPGIATAEYVQTLTCDPSRAMSCRPGESPQPVQWFQQEIPYLIHDQGSQDIHPGVSELTDDLRDHVIESFDTWNQVDCSEFSMNFEGTTPDAPIGTEGGSIPIEELINVVVWRDDTWPHGNYNAVALTTVTHRISTGQILAADIELNTADYQFSDTDNGEDERIDFRNTLTHEVGHFLGLDHTPTTSATMYATAPPGETSKRQLDQVDIDGICAIYPIGADYQPPQEDPPEDNGCGSCAQSQGPLGTLPLLLVLLGFLAIRRTRRRLSH